MDGRNLNVYPQKLFFASEPLPLCLDLDLVSRKTFASQFVPSINQLKCLPIRNQDWPQTWYVSPELGV